MKVWFMPLFLCTLFGFVSSNSYAQVNGDIDASRTKNRKNIVRWNPTPMGIVGTESFIMGYERVIASHQSISINAGQLKLRKLIDLNVEKYGVNTSRINQGYSLVVDYRRYFKKRNTAMAPDGLYWGPFFTYYHYHVELGLNYTDPSTNGKIDMTMGANTNIYHFGVQLGYQFILFKRLSIDLILLGPSFGRYNVNLYASTNADTEELDEVYRELWDRLSEKFPGMSNVLEYKQTSYSGNVGLDTFGMRYVMQIGFLF